MVEEQLLQYGVIINNEQVEESLFSLNLKDAEVYLKGIKVAKVSSIELFTLLFYSSLEIQGLDIDNSLKKLVPTQIESLEASYRVVTPQTLSLDLNGSFGEAEGYLNIGEQKLHLDITKEGSLSSLKPMLKKGQDGWYYETSF